MPKQIATPTMKGTRKKERPCKRWRDEVDEDLNIIGIQTGREWSETVRSGGRLYWKPRSATDSGAPGEGGQGEEMPQNNTYEYV
jgi:hypothetical protein